MYLWFTNKWLSSDNKKLQFQTVLSFIQSCFRVLHFLYLVPQMYLLRYFSSFSNSRNCYVIRTIQMPNFERRSGHRQFKDSANQLAVQTIGNVPTYILLVEADAGLVCIIYGWCSGLFILWRHDRPCSVFLFGIFTFYYFLRYWGIK